ncbi:MAG TPA: hypothetical protein VJT83_07520 [Chitinophagaceae bacterium]|nr:hypothetical protein [Chitinophagaceae bacterium]
MDQSNEQEQEFLNYWSANRLKEKKLLNQLLVGLPLGVIFALPVLLNLFLGWDKQAEAVAKTKLNPIVLITAVVLIIVFVAIFSRKHKWEMKEQLYREILARKERDELQQ